MHTIFLWGLCYRIQPFFSLSQEGTMAYKFLSQSTVFSFALFFIFLNSGFGIGPNMYFTFTRGLYHVQIEKLKKERRKTSLGSRNNLVLNFIPQGNFSQVSLLTGWNEGGKTSEVVFSKGELLEHFELRLFYVGEHQRCRSPMSQPKAALPLKSQTCVDILEARCLDFYGFRTDCHRKPLR